MRHTAFTLVILTFLLSTAYAQGAAKLTGWSYHSDNRYLTPEWADKTGSDLTDGSTKSRVIYAGGTVIVDVNLGKPTLVNGVSINVARPNNNYKLRDWTVQAKVLGNWRDLGTGTGFWGPTKETVFSLAVGDLKETTDQLRLIFNTSQLLCISEIEILGQAVAAQGAPLVDLPYSDQPTPAATSADVDKDGKPEVILENSQVRLIFWPESGGVCRSFYYKPARTELVGTGGRGYGAFREQLWSPLYMFAERPYSFRTGGDDSTAWVELSVTGAGGMMGFTTLTKRLQLAKDSPVVKVQYKLQNEPSSQTDYTYGLWFHNFFGVPGARNTYYYPTAEGVREYTFESGKPVKISDAWFKDPVRGWTAVCAESGTGLAASMDYKYLNCFYNWAGASEPTATHEWRFNRIFLKAGQSLETNLTVTPFQGLPRVDGVIGDIIGGIELDPANATEARIHLILANAASKPAQGLIRVKSLPKGEWKTLSALEVTPGKPATQTVNLAALPTGGYVLSCQLSRAGKVLDDFERPFSRGDTQIAYKRESLEKRVGLGEEEKATLPRHDLTDSVESPHVKWATPLRGGPIKAVVLCDAFSAREIIELKQRLQLDLTSVKFRTTFWTEDLYCGDRSISTPEQANKRLQEYLAKNKYDLFIISGFNWNAHFKPETQKAILEQVKAGAGLICIEPDGFKPTDELAPAMGVAKTRAYHAYAKWQPALASPLTAGLPWDIMPVTRYMEYTQPPQGEILATLDNGKPLLVTNQLGKGRTVALTYDTLTHEMSYRGYAGIIPIFSYRGAFLRDEYKQMTWPYWEPYYALLSRVACWAAQRDTGVQIAALAPVTDHQWGQQANLTLRLTGGAGAYKVTANFLNRQGQPVKQIEIPWQGGQPEAAIPIPANLPAGTNIVDVIVRNPAGESVAWAETYVKASAPVAIKTLTPEKLTYLGARADRKGQLYDAAFRSTEPMRLTVTLDALVPQSGDHKVRARLYDNHDRLLFEQTRTVEPSAAQLAFEPPPLELRNAGLKWEVATLGPQGQEDVADTKIVCLPPRDWDRFKLTSWGGIYPWRSEYTWDTLAPRIDGFVDVSFGGPVEAASGKTWLNLWNNIGYSDLDMLRNMGKDIAPFMDDKLPEKSAKYQQSGDKQYLIREPSLSDPAWRQKVMASLTKRVTEAQAIGGGYDYCMGDEMSLTSYTQYFDFDFSPHSLAAFREWLKARYPSVVDLNKSWDTTFATWDEVMPLTLAEAKKRENAAPWCEFRDFMNDELAGFYAEVQKTIAAVDPQTHAGLSGTQEPRAGNGMDWWKNSKAFNYYHSYNTGWSNEMRRSFAPYTGVMQSPYFAGYWQSGRQIEYNMLWCLFHDTTGISAWNTDTMFYPDYTYSEAGRDTVALCQEFKRGLWDAVRSGARVGDGIAVHYSHDSINAGQLLAKEEEQKDVRDVWVKLLEDSGLQYNFVATEQIENGLLTHPKADFERYKVLILPQSFAISDKERAEIEAFVKAGGTVIADNAAGILDGHCRKQPQGMLDTLFGIKRDGKTDTTLGVKLGNEEIKLQAAEPLTAAGAKPLATSLGDSQTPAVFRNQLGKGLAWYLNLDLRPYDNERMFHTVGEKQIRNLLSTILTEANLKPQYTVTLASGAAPNIEVIRYRAGDLIYLGLLSSLGEKEELATVKLPVNWYVYDVRQGTSLGQRQEIRAAFEGKQCRVYCLSPKPLATPQITLPTATAAPGGTVHYTASLKAGSDTAKQVVRLTVTAPNGKECPDYARNLILGSKPTTAAFNLALSDQPGTWKLSLRDVCSGAQATSSLLVK